MKGRQPKPTNGAHEPVTNENAPTTEQLLEALQRFQKPTQVLTVIRDDRDPQSVRMLGVTSDGRFLLGVEIEALAIEVMRGAQVLIAAEKEAKMRADIQKLDEVMQPTKDKDLPTTA